VPRWRGLKILKIKSLGGRSAPILFVRGIAMFDIEQGIALYG